ncbi:MAG: ATP synthase F1 subunit delta [Gemmatimonadales bacterium]
MREHTIARNYAEALFELGERTGETERYAKLMDALADAVLTEGKIRVALESPRVAKDLKVTILQRGLEQFAPAPFLRFLASVVRRGRQGLFPAISEEFMALLDEKFNRVHAGVTTAREPDQELREAVRARLSAAIGKDVIPHFHTDPSILGGVVVRVGDRIMDGSLRRKMANLRSRMLGG